MTRHLIAACTLIFAGAAQADPSREDLADLVATPAVVSAPLQAASYLGADVGFADAMRILTTLTLPRLDQEVAVPAGATLKVRTVHSEAWTDDQRTAEHTVRPSVSAS